MMLQSYHKRLIKMALRDPLKIPTMLRLKLAKRAGWKAGYAGVENCQVPPPIVISLRPNQGCNLRCVMCPQWGDNGVFIEHPELARRTVTTEEIKAFIDDVAQFRPYLYLSGGEPLLNKDIFEIIRYASSRHLVTSVNTNGSFIKGREEEIVLSGLDYLYTSLDAPTGEMNDYIRPDVRGGGSFHDAVDGLQEVLRLRDSIGQGLPIIQTKTVLVQENHRHLLDMARFIQNKLKVDMWGVGLCVHTSSELNQQTTETYQREFGQDQHHWAGFVNSFSDMDYGEIQRQYEMLVSERWDFVLRLDKPLGMPGFDWKVYYESPEVPAANSEVSCMNPYVFAQMQPNGDLAFCGSQPDYAFGNIRDGQFLDMWNGERARRWRQFLSKDLFASCSRCWSLYEYQRFLA